MAAFEIKDSDPSEVPAKTLVNNLLVLQSRGYRGYEVDIFDFFEEDFVEVEPATKV